MRQVNFIAAILCAFGRVCVIFVFFLVHHVVAGLFERYCWLCGKECWVRNSFKSPLLCAALSYRQSVLSHF